jgi:hypothetical protein
LLKEENKLEKEFVLFDEASALKKIGFDNPCFGYYENQDKNLVISYDNTPLTEEQNKRPGLYKIDHRNSVLPQWATAAPTYSQALKWFRDKYAICYYIKTEYPADYGLYIHNRKEGAEEGYDCFMYDTYEEAELACIKKLIELASKNQL